MQLDSIRVVERAHHHILFSRHGAHRPRHLEALQAKAPALFEHWTHDASLIPLEHYPHWRHRFAHTKARTRTHGESASATSACCAPCAITSKPHGPSLARDFAHLGGRTGPWWGWGPAKAALEYLWRAGELAVLERDGFEKIYDLAERAIPRRLREAPPVEGRDTATGPARRPWPGWARHAENDRRFLGPCERSPRPAPGSPPRRRRAG